MYALMWVSSLTKVDYQKCQILCWSLYWSLPRVHDPEGNVEYPDRLHDILECQGRPVRGRSVGLMSL